MVNIARETNNQKNKNPIHSGFIYLFHLYISSYFIYIPFLPSLNMKEGRKVGKNEGRKERRKEGKKERRNALYYIKLIFKLAIKFIFEIIILYLY